MPEPADIIFSHRGICDIDSVGNSKVALEKASQLGFSVETDIRLFANQLVVSHDAELSGNEDLLNSLNLGSTSVALNLKSDGLLKYVEDWFASRELDGSFVFDGSIPEMYRYQQHSIPHALRLSEFEPELSWIPNYIWLDAFESDWWLKSKSMRKSLETLPVVIVSPELHGRDPRATWDFVADNFERLFKVSICTDRPHELWSWIA